MTETLLWAPSKILQSKQRLLWQGSMTRQRHLKGTNMCPRVSTVPSHKCLQDTPLEDTPHTHVWAGRHPPGWS